MHVDMFKIDTLGQVVPSKDCRSCRIFIEHSETLDLPLIPGCA
jgi:hypothetical protein